MRGDWRITFLRRSMCLKKSSWGESRDRVIERPLLRHVSNETTAIRHFSNQNQYLLLRFPSILSRDVTQAHRESPGNSARPMGTSSALEYAHMPDRDTTLSR